MLDLCPCIGTTCWCQHHGRVEENYYNGVATIHRGSVPRASGGKGALKFQGTYTDVSPTGAWMAKNQLGRRNVTPLQASYLRGFRYISEVKDVGGQEGIVNNPRGLGGKSSKQIDDREKISLSSKEPKTTAEKIAKETGVTDRTIKNDAKFADAVVVFYARACEAEVVVNCRSILSRVEQPQQG